METNRMLRLTTWLFALSSIPWHLTAAGIAGRPGSPPPAPAVIYPADASAAEGLAAREARRYVYLRTGRVLALESAAAFKAPLAGAIVIGRRDRPLVREAVTDPTLASGLETLARDQYWIKTLELKGRRIVVIVGGDDAGVLYGAYRFAEHLGVRFYPHGDVLPDHRVEVKLPVLDERAAPLFGLRGIQPFHDFPEGPDWWDQDDYQAVLAQLPKLRMNFFGLHTYPEDAPNAEPTVWIGAPGDVGERGQVKFSYPSSFQNTLRGNWGYAARKTSEFSFGAADLFEHDAFGAAVMIGACPNPAMPADHNALFERTAGMLRGAFEFARRLGIKTCVGTETPLKVPKLVADRLRAQGKDPGDIRVIQELYTGMFQRITQAYPIDYYWFWTPEGWTWEGTKPEQIQATLADLSAAIKAAKEAQAPFGLATCGWVLGPQNDRALFDKALPKEIAVSCINREVGKTPVDRGFAEVRGRGKWAIPWLEDDPGLTAPQLWVGRMRRDAADARRYGCDGLMGIHWRTRVLAPAAAALAQAAWRQDGWNPASFEPPLPRPRIAGPVGGQVAAFPNNPIAGTDDPALYQTVRYNVSAYHLSVPDGACNVILKFCEPHYSAAEKRVFDVRLQGRSVIERLDIFARVGQNRALDFTFPNVTVTNGWLDLEFSPVIEFPSIAAIVVEGAGFARKINCGGPAYKDYVADLAVTGPEAAPYPSTRDFYLDWALHEFGLEVGAMAAPIFERIDGRLPRPADWVDGPGGIRPDTRSWEEAGKEYEFVEQFEALSPLVRGAGNRSRFDYWLETFRYMRAMARVNCTWNAFNQALQRAQAAESPSLRQREAERALDVRRELVARVAEVYQHLLATVSNPGELGTVANWEQHLLPGLLTKPGEELAKLLGQPLPGEAQPARTYDGPARVIVPTVRTSLARNESLRLKVMVLSRRPLTDATFHWRRLGEGSFAPVPLKHVARGVYSVELPRAAMAEADVEYYVKVTPEEEAPVFFPATAPAMNQTVVLAP
jgi:hypothetical protein